MKCSHQPFSDDLLECTLPLKFSDCDLGAQKRCFEPPTIFLNITLARRRLSRVFAGGESDAARRRLPDAGRPP